MSSIDHGAKGDSVDFFHHGKKERFWVDPHGGKHECFQALKVKKKSEFVYFGRRTGRDSFKAFSTPALVCCEATDEGSSDHFVAVAITVDSPFGAAGSKVPNVYKRTKVVLFGLPRSSSKVAPWYHVDIATLRPPEGDELRSPLPSWCIKAHESFLHILVSSERADTMIEEFRKKEMDEAAASAAAATAAAAAEAKERQLSETAQALTELRSAQEQLVADFKKLRTDNTNLCKRVKTLEETLGNLQAAKPKPVPKGVTQADVKRMLGDTEAKVKRMLNDTVRKHVSDEIEERLPRPEKRARITPSDEDRAALGSESENQFLHGTIHQLIEKVPMQSPAQAVTTGCPVMVMPSWGQPFHSSSPLAGGMVGCASAAPSEHTLTPELITTISAVVAAMQRRGESELSVKENYVFTFL